MPGNWIIYIYGSLTFVIMSHFSIM